MSTPADFANPAVNGTLLNTGGRIIGADGAATYGAFRAVGDVTGARPGVGTGNGLVDTKRAEIHIVVRSHGPALLGDPAALAEQLNLFFGGCPPNTVRESSDVGICTVIVHDRVSWYALCTLRLA